MMSTHDGSELIDLNIYLNPTSQGSGTDLNIEIPQANAVPLI